HRSQEISAAPGGGSAEHGCGGGAAPVCYVSDVGAAAGVDSLCVSARLSRTVFAAHAVHAGPGRALTLPGLHPGRIRLLSATAVVAGNPPLQRLAHGIRSAVSESRL